MIRFSADVAKARSEKRPVVVLESTIISHGLPRPKNVEVAREVEEIVRSVGAIPATIAIIDGRIHVGLEPDQLIRIANDDAVVKASIRDLPIVTTKGLSAATTVAATSHIAHSVGFTFFATGGLGGVHRGASQTWDESADLSALATTPVLVVCAGAKSILDIPATLERLETLSVPILGFGTNRFPGFYLTDSGYPLEYRVDTVTEVADIWSQRNQVGIQNAGMIIANPVKEPMDRDLHDQLLKEGLDLADTRGIRGKDVTPFLLDFFHTQSKGESLRVNIEIIKANARLAAQIAVASIDR